MPRAVTGTVDLLKDRREDLADEQKREQEREDAEWLHAVAKARRRYGAVTARNSGLYSCPACWLLSARPATETSANAASPEERAAVARDELRGRVHCPRCGTELHSRKPASLARTWAYLISAFILYIPANLFPITDTKTLFEDQSDTIFSGVVYLWLEGSWPLALLVFFASIVVPLAKLVVLSGLAWSVQRRTLRKPGQRTRLYRIVEFIGRWSMLDIFAVSILTALVQLKSLAEVTAGPGVLAFGTVCVLTILASSSFDPRLIWDAFDEAQVDPDEADD